MAESQLYRYVILNPAALRMCATKKRERGESLRERRESRAFIIELIEQEQQFQKPNRNPQDLMVETCKNHGQNPLVSAVFPLPTVRSLGRTPLCHQDSPRLQRPTGERSHRCLVAELQFSSFPIVTHCNYNIL